ncbi:MAG: tRNA 4-thiouridine(8) synthase ThiI [Thermoanaerobaculaceae bacterium]|nr:tRNA 4-thiouridine(8) synthase ThiI [Thermoanaerobaculaceae bacterium]MDI9621637.1 tRNA uracil 4-sulfurtransferase ThiI [Acidobacteriota bacterium]HPW55990.1 tRNA uracil 4-sulfurtransferase ThiI [Thermoanaerobaculaceae bacterium]
MDTSWVLAAFSEVALKRGNRGFFERRLRENVLASLAGLPVAELGVRGRIVIRFSEPVRFAAVAERLSCVLGLSWFAPVIMAGRTLAEVEASVMASLDPGGARSFGVRCRRSDKRFPLRSQELARALGAAIQRVTGLAVDLDAPELVVEVFVQDDGIYVGTSRCRGRGGLPIGTSGRVVALLSGGIDSPVAAYQVLRRGVRVAFVHFHSVPYTGGGSLAKVRALASELCRYQGSSRLALVPFAPFQREVAVVCPARLRVVLFRRMMIRVAARMARRWNAQGLVTGEALNQVASQTLSNLGSIDRVAHLPVLRPLVGCDKEEIIRFAETIGTSEMSVGPDGDACTHLLPDHPARDSTPGECELAEAALDVDGWARRLQAAAEIETVQPPAWQREWRATS